MPSVLPRRGFLAQIVHRPHDGELFAGGAGHELLDGKPFARGQFLDPLLEGVGKLDVDRAHGFVFSMARKSLGVPR